MRRGGARASSILRAARAHATEQTFSLQLDERRLVVYLAMSGWAKFQSVQRVHRRLYVLEHRVVTLLTERFLSILSNQYVPRRDVEIGCILRALRTAEQSQ